MPRHKSPDSRKIVLPIRFNEFELNELVKRAGDNPLSTWIRGRALSNPEVPYASTPSSVQSDPLPPPPLEGGVPAPIPDESYTAYQRRLDHWAMEALTDEAQRARIELVTAIGTRYGATRHRRTTNV